MQLNTLIIGAGAAGMMAAAHSGPGTLVIDHAKAPGEKIRISGGGRCNFTNLHCAPDSFITGNPHFHKSALARYSQWDFIALVDRHGIAWHEKTLGQLFCDGKATQIIHMLRHEMTQAGADLWLQTSLAELSQTDGLFRARLLRDGMHRDVTARNLIVACGGKSIPKMGATGLAYDIARQFGHSIVEPRPGLVPLTFEKDRFTALAGVSTPARVAANGPGFDEALLFTHRGLSGPAILQASNYWQPGEDITVRLLPERDLQDLLKQARRADGRKSLTSLLSAELPKRLVAFLAQEHDLTGNLADLSDRRIAALGSALQQWRIRPTGSEGYRTAEVTLGGVATDDISSKTMMSRRVEGLYFVGEALDVTGWLGGYNFQWAWSSGVAAGQSAAQNAPA